MSAEHAIAQRLMRRLVPRMTKYIPHVPTPKQQLALCLDHVLDVFYGGAGGGGKSDWHLMSALQYIDIPGYSSLLLRRTYAELAKPGALMDRAHQWLSGTDAKWDGNDHCWRFPTSDPRRPATLQFGYLDTLKDRYQYQSAEFQHIGFDELTEFEEEMYTFLFSRLRRIVGMVVPETGEPVPLRMRGASNPGGIGHVWVKRRYIDYRGLERVFIPARLEDNPYLDQEAYDKSLGYLDPITKARIREGDWTVLEGASIFDREWFKNILDVAPVGVVVRARGWDLAATKTGKRTAGVRMSKTPQGLFVVEHVVKGQWNPGERDEVIKQTAETDGRGSRHIIELEPGSGGLAQNAAIIKMLAGWRVESETPASNTEPGKFARAGAFASQAKAGNVAVVRGPWLEEYLDELHSAQPKAPFLDQMDASSLVFNWLTEHYGEQDPPNVEDPKRRAERDDDEEQQRTEWSGFRPR